MDDKNKPLTLSSQSKGIKHFTQEIFEYFCNNKHLENLSRDPVFYDLVIKVHSPREFLLEAAQEKIDDSPAYHITA